jgi:two-component system chemotaxis response regulator CheY
VPQIVRQPGFEFNALRVIVVEDNETNRRIICRMMRQLQCAVVESAADGYQALTTIQTSPHGYDLIISDFQMPGMNGLELLKQVRLGAPGINRDIGFIMLTGHADNFIVGTAFNLNVDSFVVKPVTPKALRARISHVMSTTNQIKRPIEYSEISVNPSEIAAPKSPPREMAFVTPPWESESVDNAGIVERDLSGVKPGSKLAADLYSGSGELLLPSGQTLDEQTLDRLRNLAELDATVSRLMVREAAR